MPIKRTVVCDICNRGHTEEVFGSGFPDWMQVNGIKLDGNDQVWLCPTHRNVIADHIDMLKQNHARDVKSNLNIK